MPQNIIENKEKNDKKREISLYNSQQDFIKDLEKVASNVGAKFTDYGLKCMINAYNALLIKCKNDDIKLSDFDGGLLRTAFSNVGYTELNFAANECYFDVRKVFKGDKENKVFSGYTIVIRPQGCGNEKLVRKYGINLKELHQCWLIREGDKFILPSFSGLKMTEPVWERNIANLNNKVIMVVYPVELKNGNRVEYLMATRESVKANLVAHIRQNLLYKVYGKEKDKKYDELDKDAEKMTLDQLLDDIKWREWINPNWISSSSRESMIIRKMQNNALKNYPKEYDSAYARDAVQNMNEDYDDSLDEKARANAIEVDVVEKVEEEIKEEPVEGAVQDFQVDDNGEIQNQIKESDEKPEEKPEEVKLSMDKNNRVEAIKKALDSEEEEYGF